MGFAENENGVEISLENRIDDFHLLPSFREIKHNETKQFTPLPDSYFNSLL
jgi:hypothetical protein